MAAATAKVRAARLQRRYIVCCRRYKLGHKTLAMVKEYAYLSSAHTNTIVAAINV